MSQTQVTAIKEPVTDTCSAKLSLTLEEGDGDLELSSLAIFSSCGDMVTSGTVDSSASWNDEGLERIMISDDRGLFPSDTRRFGMDAASLRLGFLFFAVLSPHPSVKVEMTYKLRDSGLSQGNAKVRRCYLRIKMHFDSSTTNKVNLC